MKIIIVVLASLLATAAHAGSPPQCLLKHELAHAGGWPVDHVPTVFTKECGMLPMPKGSYPIKGKAPIIHYVPNFRILGIIPWMYFVCGPFTQACSTVGGDPAHIYLPQP